MYTEVMWGKWIPQPKKERFLVKTCVLTARSYCAAQMSLSTECKAELEPKTKSREPYCLPLLAVASLAYSHQLPCSLLFRLVPAVDHTGRQLDFEG